jgi:hypothetical protein
VKSNAEKAINAMPPSRLSGADRGQVLSQAHAGI